VAEQDERKRALRSMKTFSGAGQPPADEATRAVLTVQSGPEAGRVVPLASERPNTVGRGEDCTVALADARLSRVHASIRRIGGQWLLTDEGSTNGTFVNGSRVESHSQLDDGARVLLAGTCSLRFSLVTEAEEVALARVYEAAMRDGLTGVYNRKALDERLASEVAFAVRHATPLSIALLDVDDFKAINDAHGHLVGDEVLHEIALRLGRAVRTEDVVGRYGGEEFVVLAREINVSQAAQLAERLRRRIAQSPIVFGNLHVPVSASFGVASLACCGERKDVMSLLRIADERLYAAKRAGRNRVVGAPET
jgi:two-component system cell cycle response regulator